MEPPLSSREKKLQRSCFRVPHGALHHSHRHGVAGEDTPRYGQVTAWVRAPLWQSDSVVWLAEVKLFRLVMVEDMKAKLSQACRGKVLASPPWTFPGMHIVDCDKFDVEGGNDAQRLRVFIRTRRNTYPSLVFALVLKVGFLMFGCSFSPR